MSGCWCVPAGHKARPCPPPLNEVGCKGCLNYSSQRFWKPLFLFFPSYACVPETKGIRAQTACPILLHVQLSNLHVPPPGGQLITMVPQMLTRQSMSMGYNSMPHKMLTRKTKASSATTDVKQEQPMLSAVLSPGCTPHGNHVMVAGQQHTILTCVQHPCRCC